jgi:hypothetical protein
VSEGERVYEWPTEEADPEPGSARLHRPWRAVVAVVELVAAAVAVWLAFVLWDAGTSYITITLSDGSTLTSQHLAGNHVAGAIGLGTLAALLFVDAVRQLLLAVRARHRKHRKSRKSESIADTYGPEYA